MSTTTEASISQKSTKSELLSAYNKLIKEQESLLSKNRLEEKEEKTRLDKVEKATKNDKKDIIHKIADLKIDINSSLDDLSKSLVEEKVKLEEIQEAINIESSNLKDLYEIKVNAQTLEALLISQKKQKELFEQEMGSRKAELEAEISDQKSNWKKEQEAYAVQQQDKLKLLKTEQVREAEEYQYKLKIRDQKDKDEYEQKKLKLERELEAKQKQVEEDLNQRIAAVNLQEEELKSFREAKESHAKELQEAIETTRAKTFEQLETKYKYDSQLKAKDTEATISLLNQTISFFKGEINRERKSYCNHTSSSSYRTTPISRLS